MKKVFMVVPALLIVAVVSLLSYAYFQNQKLSSYITPSNPTTVKPDNSCRQDEDCSLQIKDSWSNCKLGQNCEPIDYSQDKWIGVNNDWYQETRVTNCQPNDEPGRLCDPQPVNDQYTAKCIQNKCVKKPIF